MSLFEQLFEPFADDVKTTKKMGGKGEITFVEWFEYVVRAHRTFPEGYSKQVVTVKEIGGVQVKPVFDKREKQYVDRLVDDRQLLVGVRITDNATMAFQEGLGCAPTGKDGENFGGAMAEAEAQALKRAFANWGLGLEMYMEDEQYFRTVGTKADEQTGEVQEEEFEEPEPEDVPQQRPATDRMVEVLKVVGKTLMDYAEENHDEELEAFVGSKREILKKGMTHKRAGAVIKAFRDKLEDLGLEDPTKRDESD